jgi:CRP-like cAMP-binding protein
MNTSIPSLQDVQASRLGEGLSAEQLTVLAPLLGLQSHPTDSVLAVEGRVDERLYAVLDGRLNVVKHLGEDDQATLNVLGAGDFAHELGFLDGQERYASLVASSPARVLVLERRQLEGLIDSHPRLLYALMCNIVRVVHRVQTRLSIQASELTNYIVKQHGRY